mmetsp:Transcript_25232/g.31811  ORF Transcript_25232/g.31811 Transcript_25232/m.31811 type:complete len:561 (-) Transcript_25232:94-1776(-)
MGFVDPSEKDGHGNGHDDDGEDVLPDSLHFALKPPSPAKKKRGAGNANANHSVHGKIGAGVGKLITNDKDTIEVVSALKPYPLQPVNSGKEFFSESQKRLKAFMGEDVDDDGDGVYTDTDEDEDEEEEEREFPRIEETKGVFVVSDGGRVMETLAEEPAKLSQSQDDSTYDDGDVSEEEDNLTYSTRFDDQLSESSTVNQSTIQPHITDISNDLSFDTHKSVVQTFCQPPQPLTELNRDLTTGTETTEAVPAPEVPSPCSDSTPKHGTKSRIKDVEAVEAKVEQKKQMIIPKSRSAEAVTVSKKEMKEASSVRKEVLPKKDKSSSVSSSKTEKKFTGSVQERIEAVKRAKLLAAKKKGSGDRGRSGSCASSVSSRSSSKRVRSHKAASVSTSTSHSRSGAKESPKANPNAIKWEEHNVVFTFGLLTAETSGPPAGEYQSDKEIVAYGKKLKSRSKMLHEIMTNFGEIIRRTKSLGNGSTKYMMCSPDCVPRPVSVKRDALYNPPADRPRIKRSVVKACVPIFVPMNNMQAREVATHVVLDLFAVAISKGEFDGLTFEKVS